MDKELQSKLVEILTSIQTATGKAADFAMEQLPDIAQSYVLYGRAYTLITLLGLATVLTTLWVLAVRTARKKPNDESLFPMFMGLGVISVLAGLMGLDLLRDTLMVWLAPKVWLLREIASMLRH